MNALTKTDTDPVAAGETDNVEPTRYEVQHYTFCDGWVNTWRVCNADGTDEPQTFATIEEAQAEIDEFLADIEAEIAAGERDEDQGYDASEFCIVEVGAQ
ncbi:MAG: hypothetical protein CL557_12710 [Alphaproteobacteria bacterium]|jgi:hypothetical protein|nr:hypothetical protein [Alphaproteobacteria bacterium]MBN59155.1 hypothetical protein [Oceanospirillaceae bacterium]MAJ64501.1 hypothetical protein [Alphaproteobacteria bacterium]MAS48255.1 hypothetical protein [Alphaproteobacteria bacterium]MAX96350.1 hypothetical protein [Alphaproteobacteria bacterium]|tara:strand:- start:6770 stop:7069 length:300 start_codon:yes stop_codon:yes gene_type:complete